MRPWRLRRPWRPELVGPARLHDGPHPGCAASSTLAEELRRHPRTGGGRGGDCVEPEGRENGCCCEAAAWVGQKFGPRVREQHKEVDLLAQNLAVKVSELGVLEQLLGDFKRWQ